MEKGCSCIFSGSLMTCKYLKYHQKAWSHESPVQISNKSGTLSKEVRKPTQSQWSLWLSFFDVVWLCWVCGFIGFVFWLSGWNFVFLVAILPLSLCIKILLYSFSLFLFPFPLLMFFGVFLKFRLIIFHCLRNKCNLFMNKSLLNWRVMRVLQSEL